MTKGEYKRPDRVMTRGNEAVIIDYKFGKELKSHKEQVEEYVKALKAMGYDTVKGYVWYVPTGKITRIDQ